MNQLLLYEINDFFLGFLYFFKKMYNGNYYCSAKAQVLAVGPAIVPALADPSTATLGWAVERATTLLPSRDHGLDLPRGLP